MKSKFPERLRYLRKQKRLTMKELGDKFSLAESTISGYENGNRKPSPDFIMTLANYFDVTIDYLLGNTEDPRHNKDILEDAPEAEEVHFAEWDDLTDEQKEKVYNYIKYLRWEADQYNRKVKNEK